MKKSAPMSSSYLSGPAALRGCVFALSAGLLASSCLEAPAQAAPSAASAADSGPSGQFKHPSILLGEHAQWREGISALADGLYPVAVVKLKALLEKPLGGTLDLWVKRRLAEALIRNGDYAEGLALLQPADMQQVEGTHLWQGFALVLQQKWLQGWESLQAVVDDATTSKDDKLAAKWVLADIAIKLQRSELALDLLEQIIAEAEAGQRNNALLKQAQIHASQQRLAEARACLVKVREESRELNLWCQLYAASFELDEKAPQVALDQAQAIIALDSSECPLELRAQAQILAARAEMALGLLDEGQERLIALIEANANSQCVASALQLLDASNGQRDEDYLQKLGKWASAEQQPRGILASCWLAKYALQNKDEAKALQLCQQLLQKHSSSHLSKLLAYNLCAWFLERQQLEQAGQIMEKMPASWAHKALLEARMLIQQNRLEEARNALLGAGFKLDGHLRDYSVINYSILNLQLGESGMVQQLLNQFQYDGELKANLEIELALDLARKKNPQAVDKLARLIASYAGHPRANELKLALIEVLMQNNPKDPLIKSYFEELMTGNLSPAEKLQLELSYIIWLSKSALWPQCQKRCVEWLAQHKDDAALVAQTAMVRFCLGESYYRQGDFNDAVLALQAFERMPVNTPWRDAALFLAAKASLQADTRQSLQQALDLFELLAAYPQYQDVARLEQANILLRFGRSKDLLLQLETYTANRQLSAANRLQAEALKIDALTLQGQEDAKAWQQALQLADKLLADKDLALVWQRRLLFQKGQLHEKLAQREQALAAYYAVVANEASQKELRQREWFWFYNCAFAALRMLEEQQNWQAAVSLAQRLGKMQGPRSLELEERARRLRLEHMLW